MKAATLRRFLALHTWVGLIAGMALFIAFYAGAISVFTQELHDWPAPARAIDSLEQSQRLLDAMLARHAEDEGELLLSLAGPRGARSIGYWIDEKARSRTAYVLDDEGALVPWQERTGFVQFIYDLHFTAGLPLTAGMYLFGLFCVLYGLALVSGVVIYAPVFLKDLFALRMGANIKRLWQDAHNVIGMLSLPFHVIFAWSGAVLCIGFLMLAPFQFLVYENTLLDVLETDFEAAPHAEAAGIRAPMPSLRQIIERAGETMPGFQATAIGFHDPGDANAQAAAFGKVEQRRLSSIAAVAFDAVSGEVIGQVEPRHYTPGRAFLNALTALHFGNFGHFSVKWLYFLLGLAGAFLFYSGNLLWIEARRKRPQTEQQGRTRVMAAATLGICLGCVAGVSATFLAGALLPEIWVPRVYFTVFFASIAWAFLRPPARAGHELLWLCTLLTAAIIPAGWIASGMSPLMAAQHGLWSRFFVDACALAMAIAFWRMAAATLRRGRQGAPNSVWHLT